MTLSVAEVLVNIVSPTPRGDADAARPRRPGPAARLRRLMAGRSPVTPVALAGVADMADRLPSAAVLPA